jgi:hypothetical protein
MVAMTEAPPLPERCGVAFKEWAGVCDALAEGRQSLILRKGGIAEGPAGFVPEHPAFWLYPTHVHQAEQGLKAAATRPSPSRSPGGPVAIRALALVETVAYLDRPEALPALEGWHVWTEETVAKRFHYRKPGLWVLGVRVFVRPVPWTIVETPERAGCKTWVTLDPPSSTAGLVPVLDAAEQARRRERLAEVLAQASHRGDA